MCSLSLGDKILPAAAAELRDAQQPFRIELRILIILEKVLAADAEAFGEAQQPRLKADQALVDVVELLDQRIDAVLD